ncbi:DUF6387 family protein [Methylomonas sp. CM2]|uniref:DUF6387 family protein n=1 Tax=Methylomonas sp. CM2 TaxID=3417647 RepID=UPI003CF0E65B
MNKPKGIPEWFNLDNYQTLSTISPLEWYENLHKRRMFFTWTKIAEKNWMEGQTWRIEDAKKRRMEIINIITKKPVISVQPDKKPFGPRNTLKPLSNRDVINNYDKLRESAPPVFFDYLELEKQSRDAAYTMSYRNDELKKYFDDYCEPWGFGNAILSVGLHATDEHIIQDFKIWLAKTRKLLAKASAKRVFTNADFSEWTEYKILPYLDLQIWSIYSGSRITQAMIGNAIFPDELDVDTTERIRKTTKKRLSG